MKNIVFIGQVTDISGYGNAARSYLTSLLELHKQRLINLIIVNFSFEKVKAEIEQEIQDLIVPNTFEGIESIFSKKYEAIVLLTGNTLLFGDTREQDNIIQERPNLYKIAKRAENLYPCVVWETDKAPVSFVNAYSKFDNIKKLICACEWNSEVFNKDTNLDTTVIPYHSSYDLSVEQKFLKKLTTINDDCFSLCSVAQWGPRKGMETLLKAFFLEFKDDPVNLFLKTYIKRAFTDRDETEFIAESIQAIKDELHFYGRPQKNYKCKVIVINSVLSKEQINSIYKVSNGYITCTRGEGFGLPIAEYLNFQKPVIIPDKGGHLDFCSDENLFIESSYEPCILEKGQLYSADMNYIECSINSARKSMRDLYNLYLNDKEKYNKKGIIAKEYMLEYLSLDKNISLFKKLLEV